jgi:hypothetical protein
MEGKRDFGAPRTSLVEVKLVREKVIKGHRDAGSHAPAAAGGDGPSPKRTLKKKNGRRTFFECDRDCLPMLHERLKNEAHFRRVTAPNKKSDEDIGTPLGCIERRVATVTRGAVDTPEDAHRRGWRAREGAALISIE